MSNQIFLIDANVLITPYINYYPFDIAPSFWEQLEQHIASGHIAILDLVRNEVMQGNDKLSTWMGKLQIATLYDHKQKDIIEVYSQILQYIQNSPNYKPSALAEWSKDNVADAWLIATAATFGCTLITLELPSGGLDSKNPSKNPKIPDVASKFGVKTGNLLDMMRNLGLAL